MTSVFGAFVLSDDAIIKLFGVALSTAVLLDAFVVRLILIPSLMTIFGTANWWLPDWLSACCRTPRRVRGGHPGRCRGDRGHRRAH